MHRRELLACFVGVGVGVGVGGAILATAGCRASAPSTSASTLASGPAPSSSSYTELAHAFDATLLDSGTPGGAIAVVQDGAVAFAHAAGIRDSRSGEAVTTRTLFRLESVTKTFTALAAMSLVEKGALSLDAPINEFVPFFEVASGGARSVTLRRLLTHTSGLSRNAITRLRDVGPSRPYEDLFARNRERIVLDTPGRFAYSNTGYLLVGAAIERASALPIAEALASLVTRPLGMTTATADGKEAEQKDHASGHGVDERGQAGVFSPTWLDPYVQRPVGGMHASIEELALFSARFMAGAREVVARESFASMTAASAVVSPVPPEAYGFGVFMAPTRHGTLFTHTGAGLGTFAAYACLPQRRFAVCVVANAARYRGWAEVRRIAETAVT